MRHLQVTDSDIIEAVGFEWIDSNKMFAAIEVIFKATPEVVYRYESVNHTHFAELVSAESIGKRFHELFKKTKHPFTKSQRQPTLKK